MMKEKTESKISNILKTIAIIGIIIILIISLKVIVSCNSYQQTVDEFGVSRMYADTCLVMDRDAFRVYCSEENISSNKADWFNATFQEYETKKKFQKYGYIVADTLNNVSYIYTLYIDITADNDSIYNVCKTIALGDLE